MNVDELPLSGRTTVRVDDLVSLGDLALLFGKSPNTIAAWYRRGRIRAVKRVNSGPVFSAAECRAAVEDWRSPNV